MPTFVFSFSFRQRRLIFTPALFRFLETRSDGFPFTIQKTVCADYTVKPPAVYIPLNRGRDVITKNGEPL